MSGASVLVIRKDDRFSEMLREAGFAVSNLELIRTEPVEDLSELDARIRELHRYDGLFFTSPAAAEVFVERFDASGTAVRPKAYVLGGRARWVIADAGFEVAGDASANTAEELIAGFPREEFTGKRFLFVRGNKTVGTIERLLGQSAEIDEVIVYRTAELEPDADTVDAISKRLGRGEIEWVCFFSPSGVERFCRLFEAEIARGVNIAAIGTTTADAVERSDMKLEFVSARANAETFAAELIEHIKRID